MAFTMEALIWGRLKVSFSARVSASTDWGQLFVAASPSERKGSSSVWGMGAAVGEGWISFGAMRGINLFGALAFG